MSKSFIVIAFCLIFVAVAFGDISFKFEQDYLMQQYPVQLRITTTDENISGLTFLPRLLDDEAKRSPQPDLWKLSLPSVPATALHTKQISDFGVNLVDGNFPCTQADTKQTVAYLSYDPDTTQFTIHVTGAWDSKYNEDKGFGKWDLLCPIWVEPTTVVSQSLNIFSEWSNKADETKTANSTLATKDWRTPHIVFKSLGYAQTSTDVFSTTNVNIEFTADTVGVYNVTTINGPRFFEHSLTTGKDSDFYCTSGSDNQYARIQYQDGSVYLYVHKTSATDKQPIKCSLYLDNSSGDQFVRSQRTSVKIALANASVARTLELKYHAAAVGGYVYTTSPFRAFDSFGSSQQSITVDVSSFGGLQFSTTPMNTNSTIVFAFSKHFDVSNLLLPTHEQGYREFRGCDSITATIFVDPGANTLTLKDVETPANSIECSFYFDGSKVFAYQKDAKMGSVTVSIDGNTLSAAHAPGNAAPIYIRSQFDFTGIIHDEKESGDEITIVDTFNVDDKYVDFAVTPTEPIITFQITGSQNFNYEDYANQLSCKASTPTDTGLTDFPLTFSATTLTWSSPIKSIIEVESFSIVFQCTRKVKKVFRYGLDVTPVSSLNIVVVDLIDGKRYQEPRETTISMNSRTFASERPSGAEIPAANQYHFTMESTIVLPLVDAYSIEDNKKAAETAVAAFKSQIEATTAGEPAEKVYKDWTFETKNSAYRSINQGSSNNYVDAHIAPKLHQYIYTTLANAWTPFDLETLDSFGHLVQRSASTLHRNVSYATAYVTQWFIAKPKDNDVPLVSTFAAQNDLYAHFITKTRGSDHVIDPQDSFSNLPHQTGVDAFWATPITGCGVGSGLQLRGTSVHDVDWSVWDTVIAADKATISCNIGDSCKVNADCAQGVSSNSGAIVCKSSTCQQVPNVLPPYIHYTSVQSMYADKAFFNSASMASWSLAIIAVIAAFVF